MHRLPPEGHTRPQRQRELGNQEAGEQGWEGHLPPPTLSHSCLLNYEPCDCLSHSQNKNVKGWNPWKLKQISVFRWKVQVTYNRMYMLSCSVVSSSFATPWTAARQAPLSVGFFRQEYWSGFANSSSRGSSQPRDWTCVSCIGRQILHQWANLTYKSLFMSLCPSSHPLTYLHLCAEIHVHQWSPNIPNGHFCGRGWDSDWFSCTSFVLCEFWVWAHVIPGNHQVALF